jgi:hypothetical protein
MMVPISVVVSHFTSNFLPSVEWHGGAGHASCSLLTVASAIRSSDP